MNTYDIGTDLQDTLVELTDLALQAKQAHWNVTGPAFLPLHEQLDTLTADARSGSDDVAERAAAIGYQPDGRSSTVAKESPLAELPAGRLEDRAVIDLIVTALDTVVDRVRVRVEHLDTLDPVSQDLLIGIVSGLEKHRWMFSAQRA